VDDQPALHKTDIRPIWEQRADRGLSTPLYAEKLAVWSEVTIPQANISSKTGGYTPFKLMARAHAHPARSILVSGGIRASKSIGIAMEVIAWAEHSDLIWIAADSYELTRQEFEYAAEGLISLEYVEPSMVSMPRDQYHPCSMETVWGTLIQCRSLHDVNTFVAKAPDAIFLCEPGLADPRSVVKAHERASTRRGLVWMAGTFEEARYNWMEEYWHKWARWPNAENGKSFVVPTWANTVIYPGGRHDPEVHRLEESMSGTEGQFLLRCAGIPVPPPNLVMRDVWNPKKHIKPWRFCPLRPDGTVWPVFITVDPGYGSGSYYVVTAYQLEPQDDGSEIVRVFDTVVTQQQVHEHVINQCQQRVWWPNVASTGVIDPYAGESHVFGSVSPVSVWYEKTRINLMPPARLKVEESVGFLKTMLAAPGSGKTFITLDPVGCEHIIWEMTHWRRKPSRDAESGYGDPSKRNCDGIKTLAYMATALYSQQHVSDWNIPIVTGYRFTR